ncbi:MAG: M50 family metallopeptidase [Candidatus Micrarchaeia archaeon]
MKGKIKLNRGTKVFLTALIASLDVIALAYFYISNLGIFSRWIGAIISLVISGEIIMYLNNLKGSYGAYMLGGRHGINFIEKLSKKNRRLWNAIAEWGLTVSLGIFSIFIFKYINKKVFAIGMASLLAMIYFVMPYMYLPMNFLSIPQVTNKMNEAVANSSISSSDYYYSYALYAATFVGGFAVLAAGSIIYNGFSILASTIMFASTVMAGKPNYNITNSQIPGVAPIIPGITMPLFAGILSLIFLLVIHEFSHGVLAKIAKVKLKSVGVLLFGIIPLGAYVEPDEKKLKKLCKEKQEKIYIAGIASNLLASIIFFVIMLIMLPVLGSIMHTFVSVVATIPKYPANNVLTPGSVIEKWNGFPIKNITSFKTAAANDTPFSTISVQTNEGSYSFKTNQTGKIGVYVQENYAPKGIFGSSIYFIFTFVSLSFLLNLLVGMVNLLPIPGFDGWQIYKLEASKRTVEVLAIILIVALILNIIPWLWI